VKGSLREEQRQLTRTRLKEASLQVFGRVGYNAATVDEIAECADVSRATFYFHFPTKRDVVEALIEDKRSEVREYYERADAAFATADPDEVRKWIRDALRYFDRNRTLILVTHEVYATEDVHRPLGRIRFDYINHMPIMLSRWPSQSRVEAAIRLRLMISALDSAWLMLNDALADQSGAERIMVDVLANIWMAALEVPKT
jgi:AcrR family transcriptional regulator